MRIAGLFLAVMGLSITVQAQQTLTLEIKDFATVPISGVPLGKTTNEMLLSAAPKSLRQVRRPTG